MTILTDELIKRLNPESVDKAVCNAIFGPGGGRNKRCECGRWFDPDNEGGTPARFNRSDRPLVCGQCLHDIILNNKK